ncbi:MAG: HAMP domain-containing sensor histidine kinase [Oscillospiraceae bacterium]|nr:HAMP domain-containing sensor histidine kinase [Oscillospiraceae bacterium]
MKNSEIAGLSIKKLVTTRLLIALAAILLCTAAAYFAFDGIQQYQYDNISRIQQPDLGSIDPQNPDDAYLDRIYACIYYFDADGKLVSTRGYDIYAEGGTLDEISAFASAVNSDLQIRRAQLDGRPVLILQDSFIYAYNIYAQNSGVVLFFAILAGCAGMIVILLFFVRAVYRPIRGDFEALGAGISRSAPAFAVIDERQVRLLEAQTLVRRYNEAVRQIEVEQTEKQRAVQTGNLLVSNLAHDLKSPITVLKGYAEVLAEGGLSAQDEKKYFGYLYNSTKELQDLVNVLFEQINYRTGSAALNLQTLDICETLRDCCANYYMFFEKRGFEFAADIPAEHIAVSADRLALERVFGNLLRNILDHNETPCRVSVSCARRKGGAEIVIADDGKGIPAASLPQLFEPFYRADASRTDGGHRGLGLFAAKQIIEQHGGTIAADSPGGKGARFTLRLPAAAV